MKKILIDYSRLVDNAMHLIVKQSLQFFADNDLRGDHHFFISFITKYPGVVISDKLLNRYPHEMTIVLQHQFEDLKIYEDYFSVELSFDNQSERITIPFAALTAFADPSVQFGLQFRHLDDWSVKTNLEKEKKEVVKGKKRKVKKETENSDNVISLDFYNKKRL